VERFAARGAGLAYELTGGGGDGASPVVLLNGVAMSVGNWRPIAAALSPRRACLLHDFRGQLLSDKPTGPLSLEDHVEDLAALVEGLGLGAVHLVGTSYGSEVAMLLAAARPDLARSLVVIDGASEADALLRAAIESWKAAALADPRLFYKTILPWNYSAAYIAANGEALARREDAVASLPREWFESFVRLCDAFLAINATPLLGRITCPTLVLVGGLDILKHQGCARVIADGIPGARLRVIEGAGHAVVIEKPEAILAELAPFLDEVEGRGARA